MTHHAASVIIPTYNRKSSLQKTLRALDRQTCPANTFEVIVVDDGSTDDTYSISQETYRFPCRYVYQPNHGSAAARNKGAGLSSGDILIFIDDDIVAEPEYVDGLIQEHRAYANIVGMGSCITISDPEETYFSRIYTKMINPPHIDPQGSFVSFTECVTNNLSVEKDAFDQLGMMQDVAGDGPTWWGDIDFGYRAHQAGFRFRRSGKAVCRHYDYSFSSLSVFSRRVQKASEVSVHLLQKYPGIIHHLPMLYDKAPISLKKDSPGLIVHKLWHSLTAQRLILSGMENLVRWIENRNPHPAVLGPLYRWILSGYIYQGFHIGLGQRKPAIRTA